MLSIVPLLAGGVLLETGAGGSAPKHVDQVPVHITLVCLAVNTSFMPSRPVLLNCTFVYRYDADLKSVISYNENQ